MNARPKRNRRPKKSGNLDTHRMVKTIDELAQFEEFKTTILPALQREVEKGTPGPELLARFQTHAAARLITIILTDPDSGRATAAIRELSDRVEGKAAQKIEQVHRFEKLSDNELDSLVTSKLKELNDDDDESDKIN